VLKEELELQIDAHRQADRMRHSPCMTASRHGLVSPANFRPSLSRACPANDHCAARRGCETGAKMRNQLERFVVSFRPLSEMSPLAAKIRQALPFDEGSMHRQALPSSASEDYLARSLAAGPALDFHPSSEAAAV
jgi:hypothetical protein